MNQDQRPGGIPYQSKLRPYVDQIRKWRRAGFTWTKIAEKLGEQGCQTRATNLCQFMRRYRKKPFPSGAEPETTERLLMRTGPAKSARRPIPNNASTPYFEELVDEALEAARETEARPVFNVVKPTRPL
jgi:hypothetical protein